MNLLNMTVTVRLKSMNFTRRLNRGTFLSFKPQFLNVVIYLGVDVGSKCKI